jgi:hypothetical protein
MLRLFAYVHRAPSYQRADSVRLGLRDLGVSTVRGIVDMCTTRAIVQDSSATLKANAMVLGVTRRCNFVQQFMISRRCRTGA